MPASGEVSCVLVPPSPLFFGQNLGQHHVRLPLRSHVWQEEAEFFQPQDKEAGLTTAGASRIASAAKPI